MVQSFLVVRTGLVWVLCLFDVSIVASAHPRFSHLFLDSFGNEGSVCWFSRLPNHQENLSGPRKTSQTFG